VPERQAGHGYDIRMNPIPAQSHASGSSNRKKNAVPSLSRGARKTYSIDQPWSAFRTSRKALRFDVFAPWSIGAPASRAQSEQVLSRSASRSTAAFADALACDYRARWTQVPTGLPFCSSTVLHRPAHLDLICAFNLCRALQRTLWGNTQSGLASARRLVLTSARHVTAATCATWLAPAEVNISRESDSTAVKAFTGLDPRSGSPSTTSRSSALIWPSRGVSICAPAMHDGRRATAKDLPASGGPADLRTCAYAVGRRAWTREGASLPCRRSR